MRQLICIIHVKELFRWRAGGREGGGVGGLTGVVLVVGVMARVDKHSPDGMECIQTHSDVSSAINV